MESPTPSRRTSRAGGLAGKLTLAAAATLLTLLAAEAAFRIFGIGPPPPGLEVPGVETGGPDERRNTLGFRGPEWTPEPAAGVRRVEFLGDSFTYGRGVPEDRIFASIAAARLSAGGAPVEAVNISKPGWDTADEVEALKTVGLPLDPDLVVVVFFLNDATHLDSNPVIAWRMNREINRRDGVLNRISRLYDTWDWIRRRRRVAAETLRDYKESYLGSPDHQVLWERCKTALADGKQACDARGVPIAVVIFPMLLELNEDHPFRDVHERVAEACKAIGVPVLDLLPAFEGEDGPSLWIAPDNAHPDDRGHKIAGEAIARFITDSGLLSARRERANS